MEESIYLVIRESVGLGVLLLVLVGLYKFGARILDIMEIGVGRFLNDFERIADGIGNIAKSVNDD